MLSGMISGMRTKTSLTLDADSIPLARSRAEAEGLDVGRWLDRAIRHEAARGDIDVTRLRPVVLDNVGARVGRLSRTTQSRIDDALRNYLTL